MSEGEAMPAGLHARRARIAGLVACVPQAATDNEGFRATFGDGVDQVTKMTGVEHRHVASVDQTTADLCAAAAAALFARGNWTPDSIDALIFLSQTPDYRLPATACVLQDRLGLRRDIAAFDVNLGCSGYPYALWLAGMMIDTGAARRVLLLVGDTISKIVHPQDRSTALLFGDCGTATLVERDDDAPPMTFILGSDGSGARNLIVPAGGFRAAADDERNQNPPETLFMEGGEIFNFTLKMVPQLANSLMASAGVQVEDVDLFLLHQANSFMIKHLAKKIKLPAERVPVNIDRFGNTSSATIPLLLVTDARDEVNRKSTSIAMLGFGVGYSWAGCHTTVGPLQVADLVTA